MKQKNALHGILKYNEKKKKECKTLALLFEKSALCLSYITPNQTLKRRKKKVLVLLIVVVLLGDASTDVLGLAARDVNVLEQNLRGGVGSGHGLGFLDFGVDALACLLVDGLELRLGGNFPVQDLLLEAGDGVLGAAHALNFLAGL